jgi:hypothetical protein
MMIRLATMDLQVDFAAFSLLAYMCEDDAKRVVRGCVPTS